MQNKSSTSEVVVLYNIVNMASMLERFVDTVHTLKVNFICSCILFLAQIVAFSLPGWVSTSEYGEEVEEDGLWEHCNDIDIYTCCKPVEEYVETANLTKIPDWMINSRRYHIAGFVFGFISCIATILCTFMEQTPGTLIRITITTLLNFTTGFLLTYSVYIYWVAYLRAEWLQNPSLRWSFKVAGGIAGSYFLNGVLMVVSTCLINRRQQDSNNKRETTRNTLTSFDSPCYIDQRQEDDNQRRPTDNIPMYVIPNGQQSPTDELPSHWELPMDGDTKTVTLNEANPEYQQVERAFRKTMNDNIKIDKILRIQSKTLYKQFVAKRAKMQAEMKDLTYSQIERKLWHGTSDDIAEKIIRIGFDRGYCGRNGTAYGKGTYFARDASYSKSYATLDKNGLRRMFYCGVLVGRYAVGKSYMTTPPERHDSTRYDSTVDSTANPSVFVVYNDTHAYPEHLIVFKQ